MTDEKPKRPRAGKPGGDRPMRRKSAHGWRPPAGERDAPFAGRGDKPSLDKPFRKPRGERPRLAAPNGEKPRFEKGSRPARDEVRAERLQKSNRVEPPEPAPRTSNFEGERISKVMARAGVCSRRDAERWIEEGRVAVNGRALTTPAVNVRESDRIEIDGAPMQARERTRLFLFHKPPGLVTTARDEEGRPTVFAFLAERYPDLPRLVSVGRLDINTEGLLLLTNDGGLARTLELPATGWTRRYRVRAHLGSHGDIDQARLDALSDGVTIEGVLYAPIDAKLERVQGSNAWIAMGLTEGKNREIKRVLAHLGLEVTRLIRISYGPFQLGDLAEGALEEVRLKTLREQLGKNLAALAGVDFGAPLREATPAEAQERRERIEKRPRKHVSVMRREREEKSENRARIERSATADRRGRAVAVERVTLVRPRGEDAAEPASRNAKRFARMRGAEQRGADRREETRRFETARDDRGERRRSGTNRERRPGERQAHAPSETAAPRREPENRWRAADRNEKNFQDGKSAQSRAAPGREGRRDQAPSFSKPRGEKRFAKRDNAQNFDRKPRDGGADRRQKGPSRKGAPRKGGPRKPRA